MEERLTDEEVVRQNNLSLLVKEYLSLREKADAIDQKVKKAADSLKAAMGDATEFKTMGLKVVYKFNTELNQERIKNERPKEYFSCLKEPELDVAKFRKEHPELVDTYSRDSRVRPLKIVV